MSELMETAYIVLNICQPSNSKSYRYIQEGSNGIRLILYNSQSDCFGPNDSIVMQIGTCEVVSNYPGAPPGNIAVKLIPAVEGSRLGESFDGGPSGPSETPSPTPASGDDDENDDDDEDGDNQTGKSSAMTSSTTSVFAYVATMAAGMLASVF